MTNLSGTVRTKTAQEALEELKPIYEAIIVKNISALNGSIEKATQHINNYLNDNPNPSKKEALQTVKAELGACIVKDPIPSSFTAYQSAFCKTRKVLNDFYVKEGKSLERVEGFTFKKIFNFVTFPFSMILGVFLNNEQLKTVGFFRAKGAQTLDKACSEIRDATQISVSADGPKLS